MRIGVFGDSYANYRFDAEFKSWWSVLQTLGHEVECYGESSSSLIWSARMIEKYAKDYDLNIWCTTALGRYSTVLSECAMTRFGVVEPKWFHISLGHLSNNKETHPEKKEKIEAFRYYIKELYIPEDELFLFDCIINQTRQRHDNLLIIPGFRIDSEIFCLDDVSLMEELTLYPEYAEKRRRFHGDYEENRVCHLSEENNKILAHLINDNLRPGIFQASIEDFVPPTHEDNLFTRK